MPEEKSEGVKSVVGGWFKWLMTSVFGLVSGAVLMYLTPLVNNVIKPAKPVANFASQIDGMSVSFNNRSTGGTQGWWDFGDGTALEPFDPKLDIVKHAYARPGVYTVKLTLQNLIGDANDRSAQVTLDTVAVVNPEIVSFELKPLSPDQRVPAVYRLVSEVKAATHCILSLGDDRPTEFFAAAGKLERYITFNEMGSYTVRLAAINGRDLTEKMETVYVSPNDSSNPMAKLVVTYQAVQVERAPPRVARVRCDWPVDGQESVAAFRRERPVEVGKTIVSAELVNNLGLDSPVRNPSVTVSPDRTRYIVSGELVKPAGAPSNALPPHWLAEVKLITERRSPPQTINGGDIMMTLKFDSPTKIPLQPLMDGYEILSKKVKLELWDGSHKVWEGDKAMTGAKMMFKNQMCSVTALPQNDGFVVRIDGPTLTSAPPMPPEAQPVGPIRKVGFEYYPFPLLQKKSK